MGISGFSPCCRYVSNKSIMPAWGKNCRKVEILRLLHVRILGDSLKDHVLAQMSSADAGEHWEPAKFWLVEAPGCDEKT